MLSDRCGLPLSTTSVEARDAYVAAVDCLIGATVGDREHLDRAIAADPGFALAHVTDARILVDLARLHGAGADGRSRRAGKKSLQIIIKTARGRLA